MIIGIINKNLLLRQFDRPWMPIIILKNILSGQICHQGMATLPFGFYEEYTGPSSGLAAIELSGLIYLESCCLGAWYEGQYTSFRSPSKVHLHSLASTHLPACNTVPGERCVLCVYCVRVYCVRVYCVCTACVLCMYCVCIVCVLCVYCVCTVCVLCVYCVCTVCVLCVYCVCIVCVLCVYCVCNIYVYIYTVCTVCTVCVLCV